MSGGKVLVVRMAGHNIEVARVLLSADGDIYRDPPGQGWWHVFHCDYSTFRAAGFSPSGHTLAVATSSDLTLWTREGGRDDSPAKVPLHDILVVRKIIWRARSLSGPSASPGRLPSSTPNLSRRASLTTDEHHARRP
jgi:hypothetical protein